MQEGARQLLLALGLGVLIIYMVLAAQFESLVHPLTVMLALPFAMTGALGGLWITGHTLNLFSMIGIRCSSGSSRRTRSCSSTTPISCAAKAWTR